MTFQSFDEFKSTNNITNSTKIFLIIFTLKKKECQHLILRTIHIVCFNFTPWPVNKKCNIQWHLQAFHSASQKKERRTWKMFKGINLNFMLKSHKTFQEQQQMPMHGMRFYAGISKNIHFMRLQLFFALQRGLILIAMPLFGFHLPLEPGFDGDGDISKENSLS